MTDNYEKIRQQHAPHQYRRNRSPVIDLFHIYRLDLDLQSENCDEKVDVLIICVCRIVISSKTKKVILYLSDFYSFLSFSVAVASSFPPMPFPSLKIQKDRKPFNKISFVHLQEQDTNAKMQLMERNTDSSTQASTKKEIRKSRDQ